jgi:hypothetical protein
MFVALSQKVSGSEGSNILVSPVEVHDYLLPAEHTPLRETQSACLTETGDRNRRTMNRIRDIRRKVPILSAGEKCGKSRQSVSDIPTLTKKVPLGVCLQDGGSANPHSTAGLVFFC